MVDNSAAAAVATEVELRSSLEGVLVSEPVTTAAAVAAADNDDELFFAAESPPPTGPPPLAGSREDAL